MSSGEETAMERSLRDCAGGLAPAAVAWIKESCPARIAGPSSGIARVVTVMARFCLL